MAGAVDLSDLDIWAHGVPYAEFARLRRDRPVAWFGEPPPNSGFWSVHRYADIVAASRDVATYSSARGVSFEEPTDEDMAVRRTIIDTDPPATPSSARSCPAASRTARWPSTSTSSRRSPSRCWTPGWPTANSTSSTRSRRKSRSGCSRGSWACPRPAWTGSSTSATG